MARGLLLASQSTATNFTASSFLSTSFVPMISPTKCKIQFTSHHLHLHLHHNLHLLPPLSAPAPLGRLFCKCSITQEHPVVDMTKYKQAFARRMAMAGLKPHHRIALGVSGGPDSMALCALTAGWKTDGLDAIGESSGFIDGLLGIVVDHGLRAESKEEANVVSQRVSEMGIRCEVACCDWLDGRPKQGHLQEAARDMRYQIFQKVCIEHQISVLLIAHHADDQAELFILRLSRNSGVLGLAGMAFTSQMFSTYTHSLSEVPEHHGILLVRPLLDFSKEDMYKICQASHQVWVEDPTNQSPLFARNRIRMSLGDLSSCIFKSELLAVVSACRKTRSYIDHICCNLINQTVAIMDQGYAIIDLEILNRSKVEDICLSKFVALVLKFISQRHRPIRGSTSKLLLDYMRTLPCKTSFTAAGCYLCPAPGSRGTKALVCCSVDCPLPPKVELFQTHSYGEKKHWTNSELEQIIINGKSISDDLVPDASDVYFMDVTSESLLTEAKRLNILSEPTYNIILLLQEEEIKHFKYNPEVTFDYKPKKEVESVSSSGSESLQVGQICYFMNRFFVTWKLRKEINGNAFSDEANDNRDLGGKSPHCPCGSCVFGDGMVAEVRHMVESDWLYLAKLSKCVDSEKFQQQRVLLASKMVQTAEKTNLCMDYAMLSAQRALLSLKTIPVAARRGLPVLVNHQGLLLSIPVC